MARIASRGFGLLPLFAAASCGGDIGAGSPDRSPIEVVADPPGSSFAGSTSIELIASRPAQIFYTFEGQDPMGDGSTLYDGPIGIDRTRLITFLAIGHDGTWSSPKSELYAPLTMLQAPTPLRRALGVDRDIYFFYAPPGHAEALDATFTLRSIGYEAVQVAEVFLGANPNSPTFFEDGAFWLDEEVKPFELAPGKERTFTVHYRPTGTLRSAALVIYSNELKHEDGIIVIELLGRSNW